jgi:hypothetical protein
MNEVFRFMTMRSAQLVEPTTAIDLSSFLGASSPQVGTPASAKPPSYPRSLFSTTSLPSDLHFASAYSSIASQLQAPAFNPTQTISTVTSALGTTSLSTWVKGDSYLRDKHNAALWLIAAHLQPVRDATVDTLGSYIRVMHLIDSLAAGQTIVETATLNDYFSIILLAPAGVLPLLQVGPPYNPYIVPAGVADLQVVNQELLGYDKQEVSYIANVLQSESNKRITVRFEKTDQTYTTSTDTTTQTEQDTQSTERFQVQTQAQQTIQDNSNLKLGVSISASYGPSVNVKSNFDYGSSQATTDSQNASTSYAKDVTTQAVSKVTQEVIQTQRLDVVNSFRERVEHGVDNTKGSGNITGVYQYVDALYEVGVYNYGQRLLLDIIVPDPAAFLRDAIDSVNDGAVTAYNPPAITFAPSELTLPSALLPTNWSAYNATVTYSKGALVSYQGALYISAQNANIGNTPGTTTALPRGRAVLRYTQSAISKPDR